jgi:hypothetical protein
MTVILRTIILDGEWADPFIITPKLHKFIGTWRSPMPPEVYDREGRACMNGCVVCGPYKSIENCWRIGHRDAPQYITIKQVSD